MQPKRLYLTVAAVVIIIAAGAAVFYYKHKKAAGNDNASAAEFLQTFNRHLQNGETDSLKNYFEDQQTSAPVDRLLKVLAGKTDLSGSNKGSFKISLKVEDGIYHTLNAQLTEAIIPVHFSHDSVPDLVTALTFKLRRHEGQGYKITEVDAVKFAQDYITYNNKIRIRNLPETAIYSAATLKAFAAARQLKSKYDSVVWFAHVNNQAYYYVVNGKWDVYKLTSPDSVVSSKMGLVSPQFKEIVPPQYDFIHNISGTFDGLVEVEKEHRRGFYDLNGRNVLPAEYDEILPLNDSTHLAALRKGNDYFWWDKNYTVSDKLTDFKIADVLPLVQAYQQSREYNNKAVKYVMEYNSRDEHSSLYIPPSYLVDWQLFGPVQNFKNPLRKGTYVEDSGEPSISYKVQYVGQEQNSNWLQTVYSSIKNHYIGGRGDFYESKNILIVDQKRNRAFSYTWGPQDESGEFPEKCGSYTLKTLNDSLYELKTCNNVEVYVDSVHYLNVMPVYHYLTIKNNKLVELQTQRQFAFTKYAKMDDSYLQGYYEEDEKSLNRLPAYMLDYIKNEIYADYDYRFTNDKWNKIFAGFNYHAGEDYNNHRGKNTSVEDSLTEIDRYNINWLQQKINSRKTRQLATVKK